MLFKKNQNLPSLGCVLSSLVGTDGWNIGREQYDVGLFMPQHTQLRESVLHYYGRCSVSSSGSISAVIKKTEDAKIENKI